MNQSYRLLMVSLIYLGAIVADIFLFSVTPAQILTFVPLVFGIILVVIVPPTVSLGVVLTYVCFDGMLKILSGYNSIIHVGADILMVVVTLRWLADVIMGHYDDARLPPFFLLFVLHIGWVAVEIFNPYGAGFLAGIASYKYYLSFLTLYFYANLFIRRVEEVQALIWVAILIVVVQVVLGIYQFHGGESTILSLSPNYSWSLHGTQFAGRFFRPFGTSNVAGGASTFIFLTLPLVFAFIFLMRNILTRAALLLIMAGAGYILFISQVRSAVLKGFGGIFFVMVVALWRKPLQLMGAIGLAVGLWYVMQMQMDLSRDSIYNSASARFASLSDLDALTSARGFGFIDRMQMLVEQAPLGIGLSRVGGAAAVFHVGDKDQFFDSTWSFSDNLYLALVIELGVPGCILFLCLIFLPFFKSLGALRRVPPELTNLRYTAGACLALVFASVMGHYGSEGSLGLPESAYCWLFLGCAVRILRPYWNRPVDF